jgi:hypothetical protein
MFNHSTQDQNVVWERDMSRLIITYRALRDIHAGEELCELPSRNSDCSTNDAILSTGISYGSHLTFKDTDRPILLSPDEEMEQLNRIQLD